MYEPHFVCRRAPDGVNYCSNRDLVVEREGRITVFSVSDATTPFKKLDAHASKVAQEYVVDKSIRTKKIVMIDSEHSKDPKE